VIAVAAVAVIALAGGGGSSSTSKGSSVGGGASASFVAQANSICRTYNSQSAIVPKPGTTTSPSASTLATYIGQLLPLLQTARQGLNALTPPAGQSVTYQQYLSGISEAITLDQAALNAAQAGNVTNALTLLQQEQSVNTADHQRALSLGLTDCAA
jgi:hypothetical protein